MRNIGKHKIGFLLLLVLLVPVVSFAGLSINGELGVDMDGQAQFKQATVVVSDSISNILLSVDSTNSINRVISDHYLNLTMLAPIVNDNFASLSGRAKMYGSYDVTKADRGNITEYHDPKLHTYSTNLSMFPNRPFPLMLRYDKSFNRNIRSEENNRVKTEFNSPELNLVRKYESEDVSRGANWKFVFNENISLTNDYSQNSSKVLRIYDFGEYSDIYIDTTQRFPDPALNREVIFVNSLIDDSVYITLNDNPSYDTTLAPGETYIIEVPNQSYFIEFIPQSKYNDWSGYYNINYFEEFEIVATEILSPKDLDQTITSFSTNLKTEGIKNFVSETRYEYSDSRESYQVMSTFLGSFNNSMSYNLSRNSKINMLTTYSDNKNKLDTLSMRINKSFLNQTVYSIEKRGGISNTLTHTLTKMSSRDDVTDISSTTNIIRNQTTFPLDKYHYFGDLKNSMTLLKDNAGYTSNLYGTDYTSKFELIIGKLSLIPKHQIKYSFSHQTEADSARTVQKTNEFQNKFNLDLSIPEFMVFGNFRAKGEIDLKTQGRNDETTQRNRYLFDVSSSRSFGNKIKLLSTGSIEKETTGGSQPVAGTNSGQSNSAREPVVKYLYKIDLQTMPTDRIQINGNVGKIIQGDNIITRYGLSFFGDLPILNIPIKSIFSTEKREVGSNAPAIQTRLETKFDFRFRQISFIFSHLYTYEGRGILIYKDHEIRAKISRQFTVL